MKPIAESLLRTLAFAVVIAALMGIVTLVAFIAKESGHPGTVLVTLFFLIVWLDLYTDIVRRKKAE